VHCSSLQVPITSSEGRWKFGARQGCFNKERRWPRSLTSDVYVVENRLESRPTWQHVHTLSSHLVTCCRLGEPQLQPVPILNCQTSCTIAYRLVVLQCAGLTASTAHSAVSLPSSQQQRSLLKTSPAANATSCLERAKQFLQALERNVTEPAVSPCGPTERAAQAAAALADDSAKAAKCQSDQTKALMAGRNVTVECPDRKQPAKEDIDTLGSRARDLMNEAWDKYDKAAAGMDVLVCTQVAGSNMSLQLLHLRG